MPRIGRVVAPNMPHHVAQRGHNRNAVFVDDGDYSYYLDTLGKWTRHLQVKVYAWCLMTNHVHLLLDPRDDIKSIGFMWRKAPLHLKRGSYHKDSRAIVLRAETGL